MPYLLAIANSVITLRAECECGFTADYTYCKTQKEKDILIGDKQEYKPLCRKCLAKQMYGGK